MRLLTQSAFVDEDERTAFVLGFFLMCVQVLRFKTRNQAGTSIRPRMRDAPVSEFLRLKHLWGKVRLDNGQEIIATNSRFATFNDSAALLAALPQYGWFGEPVHEDSQVSLTLHTQLDPAALAGRTVAFEGLAQLQGFAWELAGSLPIEPGARLSNGSLMVEVVNRRPSALDVVLDVRYSGIADAPDPFGVRFQRERVEFLLVRPDRLQVARHFGRESYDPRDDRWRSRSRSIDRASGSVTLKSWSRPYRLPFEKGTDRYEGLELQVWKLVPTQPYRAVINVPEFRTKYQPAQYP